MKKYILLSLVLICSQNAFSQIKLNDNSIHPSIEFNSINTEKFQNILGYGMYTATIIGYADSCKFSKDNRKLIFDYYFNKINNLNLTDNQKKIIFDKFSETAKIAKEKGVINSNITCSKFEIDFEKIVNNIKQSQK